MMKRKQLWIAVAAVCGSLAVGSVSTAVFALDKPMPALTGWDTANTLTVDGESPDGRTWIYPDADAKAADEAGAMDGTGSTGFVIWELDDASGAAPGIQVLYDQPLTGDNAWALRNCIMASGPGKVCGDDPSSSKRFKLRVTGSQAEPVDLVFNVADDQSFTYEDGVDPNVITGRIYRVLMKWANFTDLRAQGFKVEVGFGTGKDFKAASGTEGIAFELSETVTRASLGDFVVGNEPTTREVWKPLEFATFSPGMYNPDDVDTLLVDESGFFGDQVAGLIPPQDVDTVNGQYIYSGELQVNGIVGATTANYFDQWGYLLNEAQLPTGYYQDDDGDAATEGFLIAWLDTSVNPAVWRDRNGDVVPPETLAVWESLPLDENVPADPPATRYEQAPIDDLAGLNVDVYLKLAETYDPAVSGDKVTLRLTPVAPGDSITPVVPPVADDGGGCTVGGNGRFDPTLPALAAAGLVFFGLRRFKASK